VSGVSEGSGVVVAVCVGGPDELFKTPVRGEVVVDEHGLRGDRHAGPTRMSRRQRKPVPNDRQISIVAQEALDDLARELDVTLEPGDFGENVCVRGFGDLSDVTPGTRFVTSRGVVFHVTEQNEPCSNLMRYHRQMVKASYGRRGVIATVEAGAGLAIAAGDGIELRRP
jgi:MOSC domain-containing protein YiiM